MSRSRAHRPPPGQQKRRWAPWRRGDRRAPERVDQQYEQSPAGEQERLIAQALVDLRNVAVLEVMTPRVDVVALVVPVTADDVAAAVTQSGHSSFPVVYGDLDDLVGVLFVNDLFQTGRAGRSPAAEGTPELSPLEISRHFRQPYLIPESWGVLDALADMRHRGRAFAVVVDEYGGVSGILTVKDLLEPLVGKLNDEFDPAEDDQTIVRVDETSWLVDGRASVDEVRERLGVDVPEGEYVTLGGFLMDVLGHVPSQNESFDVDGWTLIVVEMDRRRVAKVVVRRREGGGPAAGGWRPAADGVAADQPPGGDNEGTPRRPSEGANGAPAERASTPVPGDGGVESSSARS